jgi:hypothetical protein
LSARVSGCIDTGFPEENFCSMINLLASFAEPLMSRMSS